MDPRDRPSDTLDDAACAACGRIVPPDRVRVLARREDLAFAELPCPACGTIGLAIVLAPPVAPSGPLEPGAAVGGPPISPDDVLDMHRFLAAWTGDARSLVGRPTDTEAPGP